MRRFLTVHIGFLLVISFMGCSENDQKETSHGPVLSKLDAAQTGIDFSNNITPDVATKENLLDFDYFYNGAGVGVGDFNNDGLQDLVFTGNQVPNRLYLNKGGLKFEDITEGSGINTGKHWSNGVAVVDLNQDGWLDLYISQGGPSTEEQRANLLYINQGDLTFVESAEEYGLDDTGISTQSAFFDFDRDGDEDCFVMNESLLYGHDPITFHRLILEQPLKYRGSFSHLYRNDNGQFVDVSIESGITKPTFGLGLVVSDVNSDGWLDIYVANDYFLPDNLYINKKNGSFTDRADIHMKQMSFYGMGADIEDINNDGLKDIAVLDMASKDHYRAKTLMASMDLESFALLVDVFGFSHQYMFNSLQINDGHGRFNNFAQLSGMSKTDWSWAVLLNDLDNDGHKDMLVTNGYRKYALDNDFKSKVSQAKNKYSGNVPLAEKVRLYNEMPSEPLSNHIYKNKGNLKLELVTDEWGFDEVTFSNGAITADLDLDGDLDVVINNMDAEASIYENTSSSFHNYLQVEIINASSETFAEVRIRIGQEVQITELKRVKGYMSSLEPVAHFGIGKEESVDHLKITLPNGAYWEADNVNANQRLRISHADIKEGSGKKRKDISKIKPGSTAAVGLDHRHKENEYNDFALEVLLPQKQSTLGPKIVTGDLNNDGQDDLFIPSPSGQSSRIYLQSGDRFERIECPACEEDAGQEHIGGLITDLDGDGDNDIVIVSGGNEWKDRDERYTDKMYMNEGNATFRKATGAASKGGFSGGVVEAIDYDKDGDMDLLYGNRIIPQSYPVAAPSYLMSNDNGAFTDVTKSIIPGLEDYGIINDVEISDIDGDGWDDVIVVGEWESPGFFKNNNGVFESVDLNLDLESLKGWWYNIETIHLNDDPYPDFIIGNVGANYKHDVSSDRPLKINAYDFDRSGSIDVVLSKKYKDYYMPARGRECSSEQMPFILDKYESYHEYASSSVVDIYGEEDLENSYKKEANEFRSIALVSNGPLDYKVVFLPSIAQAFPIMDIVSHDIDNDGKMDIIIGGCIYNTEVETPRLDAGNGLVLLSLGDGQFTNSYLSEYYINIPGNVKSIKKLKFGSDKYMVIGGVNNGPLSVHFLPSG